MSAHRSLSDADVDAIEARAFAALVPGRWVDDVAALCVALRRTRAALAAACFPSSECERCGDTADVVPRTLATGEQADGAWLCRDRAACEGRAG